LISRLLDGLGDAEIGQQGVSAGQQHVVRLHIAMDHSVTVRVIEGFRDLAGESDAFVDR
jgi:hypothetical protein